MDQALRKQWLMAEQDQRISETIDREGGRLRSFIRRRVADQGDAEDILQEVFYELVEAYRLMEPIEQVGAWMFRVARNRITDLFRKKKPDASTNEPLARSEGDGEFLTLEDLLPSPDEGPDAAFARAIVLDELEDALNELPEEQRYVFLAHEVEGRSFKELAVETGLSVNTLLSRKRYAVLHLRGRLRDVYDEFIEAGGQEK
jgi:RNA polymerase sigma factor (sigma-70 family)